MSSFVKQHFANIEQLLRSQSALCQPQLPDYDIGMNREFFVREVLRTHMPSFCSITSGSVCDQGHAPSGQVDIILFHPLSPRINIGATDCCFSESVFSVIEVKSRLSEDHFRKSLGNLARIAALSRKYLYTNLKGARWSSEAYHFNTIGTVLFGYKGYSPETCVHTLHQVLGEDWPRRPEVIYCLDKGYILVREDYLMWEGDGVYQGTGSNWIESLPGHTQDGYRLLEADCLLILVTILSKRVQCNYHLLPVLWNYVHAVDES